MLITQEYFCYCWAVLKEHQGSLTREWAVGAQGVWYNKELGGDTSGTAEPKCPRDISDHRMACSGAGERKNGGFIWEVKHHHSK